MTWRERIQAARESGRFTEYDKDLASNWNTCAVGEQREAMPSVVLKFTELGTMPQDNELYNLGGGPNGFYTAVLENNINLAESLLDRIEDRVLAMKRAL